MTTTFDEEDKGGGEWERICVGNLASDELYQAIVWYESCNASEPTLPASSETFLEPKNVERYASSDYWDDRFEIEHHKDWLVDYRSIKKEIGSHVSKACVRLKKERSGLNVLVLGCGNSRLSENMHDDGFERVTSADFSPVVIHRMKCKYAMSHPAMRWVVADSGDMSMFSRDEFDLVIEKSHLDVVANDRGCLWDPPLETVRKVSKSLREISRVLTSDGGLYLAILWMQPHFQRNYLTHHREIPGYKWEDSTSFEPISIGLGYTLTACVSSARAATRYRIVTDLTTGIDIATKKADDRIFRCSRTVSVLTTSSSVAAVTPYRRFSRAFVWEHCLSAETCVEALERVNAHVKTTGGWRTNRHVGYNTTDVALRDAPALWDLLAPFVYARILPALKVGYFPDATEDEAHLFVDDIFLVKYESSEKGCQSGLEPHRDGSLLSFNVALNDPATFGGGGTHFVGENVVIRPRHTGDLVTHCGKILHGASPVTSGVRYILVGFVKAVGKAVNVPFLESFTVSRAFEDPSLDARIVRGALRRRWSGRG